MTVQEKGCGRSQNVGTLPPTPAKFPKGAPNLCGTFGVRYVLQDWSNVNFPKYS